MNRGRFPDLGLIFVVILMLLALGGLSGTASGRATPLSGPQIVQMIGWYLLAFLAFLGAIVWVERKGGLSAKWMWGAAVLFRLVLLTSEPALSTDVYRYLWDGHVATERVNPYAFAVEDPRLDPLDIPLRQQVNHSWMASPYLPGAQFLFWLMATLFPLEPFFAQAMMAASDLLIGLLLARLSTHVGLPGRRALIYLWNPLVILEVAGNAHVDAWMILLALAAVALTLTCSGRAARLLAPVLLALATLTKFLPLLLFPLLFWRWSWGQRALFAFATLLLLAPFGWAAGWGLAGESSGTGVFGAMRVYYDQWNFNSGLFHWLERWLGAPGFGRPLPAAKLMVLFAFASLMFIVWFRAREQRSDRQLVRMMALPFMAFLLLTPTVHPWYALVLLALLPFLPPGRKEPFSHWLSALPWLYLNAALILSYLTYYDPLRPAELEWVRQAEWLPTLALLVAALIGRSPRLMRRQEPLASVNSPDGPS